jgi:glycosyltransferase involved in cell wall biosynthesis
MTAQCPRVGYLVENFPPADDPHCLEELLALERCGVEVTVFTRERVRDTSAVLRAGVAHIHAHSAGAPAQAASDLFRSIRMPFSFSVDAGDIAADGVPAAILADRVRQARFVVARSDAILGMLSEICGRRLAEKLSRVYRGVDVETLPFRDDHQRRADALLAIASPVRQDMESLLRAIAALQKRRPSIQVTIVASGESEAYLKRAAARDELNRSVVIVDSPTEAARHELLRTHTVMLACWSEAAMPREIPAVFLEAMAAGLPVVATNLPGIREAIEDGWSGRLVAPGDAIWAAGAVETLLENPPLRGRMARAGRERVEREFSLTDNAARLSRLFDRRPAPVAVPSRLRRLEAS